MILVQIWCNTLSNDTHDIHDIHDIKRYSQNSRDKKQQIMLFTTPAVLWVLFFISVELRLTRSTAFGLCRAKNIKL